MVTDAADVGEKAQHEKAKVQKRLKCVAVTPERTVFDQVVDFVALPLYDGELGVLPGRSPLIGRLGYGELRTRVGDVTQRYFLDGGFAQVRDDVVTVLTDRAIPEGQINSMSASQELEQARAGRAVIDRDYTEKVKALARARAQLRLARHKG